MAKVTEARQERIAPPRTAIVISPHADCGVTAGPGADTARVSFLRDVIDPAVLGGEAAGLLTMIGAASPGSECIRFLRLQPAACDEARSLLGHIEREGREKRSGYEAMQKLKLVELLMLLYRSAQPAGGGQPGFARFTIEDAVRYVQDRYAEELSLADLASRFGFNPSYFSRLFALKTGTPLFEYVNRLRIQKSCLLLKRSRMSILEIAFSVGYNNLSHFNRYFRRIMGESPREYRARSGK